MIRKATIIFSCVLCGCSSQNEKSSDQEKHYEVSNTRGSSEDDSEFIDSVRSGDSTACSQEQIKIMVISKLEPEFFDGYSQKTLMKQFNTEIPLLSVTDWSKEWLSRAELSQIAPKSFDNFSKKMVCEGLLFLQGNGGAQVIYSLQPTSDGKELIVDVDGQATAQAEKSAIRYAFFRHILAGPSDADMAQIEGEGEVEVE